MIFTIKRDVFLNGIQKTLGIVERKSTIPMFSHVLIDARDNFIKITATDREITLIADYDAEIEKPGKIAVGAKKLHEMIRESEGSSVEFRVIDNNWIHITCGKAVYRIPGVSADEFPDVPDNTDVSFFPVTCNVLREMIHKTGFAVSTDEMRPSINGVYFEVGCDIMRMVSTDGHRLSIVTKTFDGFSKEEEKKGIIIPRKGITEIRKIVEGEGDDVAVSILDKVCILKIKSSILRVGLIDAEFPDYKKIIPKDSGIEVYLDRNRILRSLKRMSVMSSERFSGVKVELRDNTMILTSTNPDVGEATDEMDVIYEGDPFEIGYNVKYLIDAIEVLGEDSILLEMRDGYGPGVIRPVENDNYMCIIMPIKLRKE